MQTQWFRFTTQAGTVYGEFRVPSTAPNWLGPTLKRMNEASKRELTISDFTAEEWLATLCSENRPIPLFKPLSPQQQEEVVFFPPGKIEAMKAEAERLAKPEGDKPGIPLQAIYGDDGFVRKFGYFLEDLERVPEEDRPKLLTFDRNKIQPGRGRTFVNYVPLVDPVSEEEDIETYSIFPFMISSSIVVKSTHSWAKMVAKIYKSNVEPASQEQISKILPANA